MNSLAHRLILVIDLIEQPGERRGRCRPDTIKRCLGQLSPKVQQVQPSDSTLPACKSNQRPRCLLDVITWVTWWVEIGVSQVQSKTIEPSCTGSPWITLIPRDLSRDLGQPLPVAKSPTCTKLLLPKGTDCVVPGIGSTSGNRRAPGNLTPGNSCDAEITLNRQLGRYGD